MAYHGSVFLNTPGAFHEEARFQKVCAVCERPGPYHAHHVVYEQELDRRGFPRFDTRNALRICTEGQTNCHSRHHWKLRAIRTVELLDTNIAYAGLVFGEYAPDWLRRYYDDLVQPDPRIVELELNFR